MPRAPITTHILDLHRGQPAAGVAVALHRQGTLLAAAETDGDGRVQHWDKPFDLAPGHWSLVFQLQPWFERQARECFFPRATLEFTIADCDRHYHLPLLLNQFGYTTYRGS